MSQPLCASESSDTAATDAAALAARDPAADPRDRQWVARIRSGDTTAFAELFRAYYELVWCFALGYVRSPNVAEELAQDVFAQVWMQRTTWDVRDSARRYLCGAVRNRALRLLSRQRVVARWEATAIRDLTVAGVGQGPPPTDERLRSREVIEALSSALARLPRTQREAYILRWQHGLADVDIAKVMGISVRGVEQARTRAVRALREALRRFV
jgi:RNA polymerase sigma-70 factor (ECF subfamily)